MSVFFSFSSHPFSLFHAISLSPPLCCLAAASSFLCHCLYLFLVMVTTSSSSSSACLPLPSSSSYPSTLLFLSSPSGIDLYWVSVHWFIPISHQCSCQLVLVPDCHFNLVPKHLLFFINYIMDLSFKYARIWDIPIKGNLSQNPIQTSICILSIHSSHNVYKSGTIMACLCAMNSLLWLLSCLHNHLVDDS